MALQYINSPENDFSKGIDARSSENQIDPGFVKDLLNADVVEKRARKRDGYQGEAGNIPVRVTRVDYDSVLGTASFTLDSSVALDTSISLESIRSAPLVAYGKSSVFTDGPFTTSGSTAKYYPKFSIPTRKVLTAPSGTLSIPASEHGLGTTDLFATIVESTSVIDRSFQRVLTDAYRFDKTSFDISIDYSTYIDRNVFVYFSDKSTIGGESYCATIVKGISGPETFSIPTGTHNLTNYNIICQIQQDTGAELVQVVPEQFIVESDGDVSVTLDAVSGTTYRVILSAAPISNVASGVVNALSSGAVTISAPSKPWLFFGIYLEQTPGGDRELVYPDTIDFDETTNEFTLSFQNQAAVARNFLVYYEYGDVRSNRLSVEDSSIVTSGIDMEPQITLWGLDHSEIYVSKVAREGWVTHLDSYRRSGEQRLVSGLGGNLFAAQIFAEAATTYLYPTLYPNLYARTSSNSILGPLFWNTGDAPARTRGYITGDDSGTNWTRVTAVSYDSGNGLTKYTISIPNKQILDSAGAPTTLSSVISTATGLQDYLTVTDMSYAIHNGSFRIMQVQDSTDEIFVWVENDANSEDWDDSGVAGEAAVFSDQITWISQAPFILSDILSSAALEDTFIPTVLGSSGTTTVVDGMVSQVQLPGGLLFTGKRTSSLIPLRSPNPTSVASTENLVRGDMLSYTGIPRLLRVLDINPDSDRLVDIVDGVATFLSGDTSYLTDGKKILLQNAGDYSGVHTILSIDSASQLTLDTSITGSVSSGTLVGETAEVDESLEWMDTSGDQNVFQVVARWIPVEAPEDSYNQTPDTYVRHLDTNTYSDQPFLRSTMVQDNMYLTNYEDAVQKFDGNSIYRAGLPSWQPGLFVVQDTAATAKIVTDLRQIATSSPTISASEGKIGITSAQQNVIPVGTRVRITGSTETYTIRDYTTDGTDYYVVFDRAISSSITGSPNIQEIGTFRYYYRLNAVDANDNIIASAVTGYQDHVVELTQNAAIYHKITGLPSLDNYDYDRLEVQIYRTKKDQAAPFYSITTLSMDFDNTQGYVEFTDSFADSDLTQLDVVNTALKGAEIGINFQDAPRARYITSVNNKLVLANLKDYPEFDMQIVGNANLGNSDFAGDKFLFRKSNSDIGTITNMSDRVTYEWKNGFSGDVSNFTIGSDQFSFDTDTPLAANPGDWIYLTYATVDTANRDLSYSGWYQIADCTASTVTVNLVGAASAAFYPDKYSVATVLSDVPVLLGVDGNLGQVNGDSFDLFDSTRRLAMAINSTMRMTDTSLTGFESFRPWLVSRSGNDVVPAGRIIVRSPIASQVIPEVVPTFSGYSLFINSVRRTTGTQVSSSTRIFPSRIVASAENYPEIFDNTNAILDSDSDSAIDVNSADGQEITGIIPFFGEAAFTAAQQAAILVVFKTNSVYLVDLNEKAAGRNAVQRIETEGLGCTAPYSIAVTKNGVMFANESGIYCLRRSQKIDYVGKYMERNWTENVDRTALSIVHGHHFGVGRVYKLSVPYESETEYTENSEVFVYNHTSESDQQLGAWSRYDNHPAIGWANMGSDAYFASTLGRVFSIRNTGTNTDFRDDSSPIDFILEPRPNDFGNSGIRKTGDKVIIHYRSGENNVGTSVGYSLDLEEEFTPTTPIELNVRAARTGLQDKVGKAIDTVMHSLSRRRFVYLGIQIRNRTMDESIEIAGIDFKVGGLNNKGILQAAETTK